MNKLIFDLHELLSRDVLLARTELLKPIQVIRMVPRKDTGPPHYEAAGEWNLVGSAYESGPGTRPSNSDGCGSLQRTETALLVLPFKYEISPKVAA